MTDYFRSNVDAMASYVPGEQPPRGTQIIKLNSNENPYPPSSAALAVLRNIDGEWLRRYPEPFGEEFRQATSKVLGVPSDWIIVGNGSDEVLSVVIRACAEPRTESCLSNANLRIVSHFNRNASSGYY